MLGMNINRFDVLTVDEPRAPSPAPSSTETSKSSSIPTVRPLELFKKTSTDVRSLGLGGFGEVFSIERGGKKCAAKISKTSPRSTNYLRQEWELQRALQHQNIVEVFDYFEGETETGLESVMIMELGYMDMGKHLETKIGTWVPENRMKLFFKDLLLGLQYLKSQNIFHRDIKPQNLIIFGDRRTGRFLKIADFGLAKKLDGTPERFPLTGTRCYLAPECFASNTNEVDIGFQTDIWAAGVVLFECLKGYHPFESSEMASLTSVGEWSEALRQAITECKFGDMPPKARFTVTPKAEELIRGMLQINYKDRWTVEQCLEHPWITELPTISRRSGALGLAERYGLTLVE